jgi:hypothetical protein
MVLFLLYSALGFFTVPYFIEKELVKIANNDLNSQFSVEEITFNPFTISSSLTAVKLIDNDSTLWFSSDQIQLDIHLWKTLFKHLSIANVSIDKPYANLIADKDNNLKYPQLNPSQSNDEDIKLLLDIDLIEINKGNINYLSSFGNKEVNINLQQIAFHHQQFTTQDKSTTFELSFVTNNNEETQLTGQFNFAQLKLDLNWKLNNWLSATIFELLSDENNQILGLNNHTGTINADGTLSINNLQTTLPQIHINQLQISQLSTEHTNNSQPQINIPELTINDIDIDLNKQLININSINSSDTELSLEIDENYALIWPELNQQNMQQDSNSNENSNWLYQLNQVNLSNTLVKLNKHNKGQNHLNNIYLSDITVNNISSKKQQSTDIKITLNVDKQGQVEIAAQVILQPFELNTDIKVSDINIAEFKTWLPTNLNLSIEQGLLSLQQKVSLKGAQYTSTGRLGLKDLKILDNNKQEFLVLKQFEIMGNRIDSKSKTISLTEIKLDQAQGSLTITDDQQLNINQLVAPSTDVQDSDSDKNDWIIEINAIKIIDSKTDLTDQSIDPHYHTELSKLNGSINGLSSSNLSKAEVDLSGVLDTYGKINISGQINPLSDDAYTDLSIEIENLSLENFSSYSAKFLGFPITRGKADFQLKYKLNQNLLKGFNGLKFKQLKFGDKNQSEDAISLPLKLAVSLLTNGKGIMKIDLPVNGNIDDPEFSYGGIVFKAMFKLITGIVASPFKLLGKLIPGGAELDLSGILFKAGTVELAQDEEKKLHAMQKIIEQRPAIILELTGVINTTNDKKQLQQLMLLNNLAADTINFDDSTFQDKIKQSYLSTFNQQQWDKLLTNANNEQPLNLTLLSTNAYNQLLASQDVTSQLDILAKQRAQFIQQQMIKI